MPRWIIRKVLTVLKQVVHSGILPSLSQEEREQFYTKKNYEEKDIIDILKFIYKKSDHRIELYGDEKDMYDKFQMLEEIPFFLIFSRIGSIEMMSAFCMSATLRFYPHPTEETLFTSKGDIVIRLHQCLAKCLKNLPFQKQSFAVDIVWINALTKKHLRRLRESYDLIDSKSMDPFFAKLSELFQRYVENPQLKFSSYQAIVENFKQYHDPEDMPLFDKVFDSRTLEESKNMEISTGSLDLWKNIQDLCDEYDEILTPFSPLSNSSLQKPCIRYFKEAFAKKGVFCEYFQAKEVDNALRVILKLKPEQYSTMKLPLETEAERKMGIVNTISPREMEDIVNKLGASATQLIIFSLSTITDTFETSIIYSSYGTHCVPAVVALDKIMFYLSVILRVFQRSNAENLQKVFDWIEELMDTVFRDKPILYFIETWKIDEIIDRARKELSQYLTEPEYQIVYQKEYQRNEVFREVNNLAKNLGMEDKHIETIFNEISHTKGGPFRIVDIGDIYTNIMQCYFFLKNEKFKTFWYSQESTKKIDVSESMKRILEKTDNVKKEQVSTGWKRGFLMKDSPKKQEAEKNEESPSKPENAKIEDQARKNENIQELREKLDQLQKENLKLRKDFEIQEQASSSKIETEILKRREVENQLETEKSLVKKCETDIQSLQEQLEQSKKELSKAEKNLKIHLKASSCQIAKLEEELQTSKEAENQLTERLKTMEQDKLEEMNTLKKYTENMNKDNQYLNDKIERLEEKNLKNSEFQRKIKKFQNILEMKHSNLIDSASSHLRTMTAQSVKEAKEDIEMLEVTLDEYMENVDKEFEKL